MPNIFKFTKEQKAWLKGLESGKYRQVKRKLTGYTPGNRIGHCCLGVACVVLGTEYKTMDTGHAYLDSTFHTWPSTVLPVSVQNKLHLHGSSGEFKYHAPGHEDVYSLADLNDNCDYSFKKIAKFIRENPQNVFKKGA